MFPAYFFKKITFYKFSIKLTKGTNYIGINILQKLRSPTQDVSTTNASSGGSSHPPPTAGAACGVQPALP